jgi:hypothetical protein
MGTGDHDTTFSDIETGKNAAAVENGRRSLVDPRILGKPQSLSGSSSEWETWQFSFSKWLHALDEATGRLAGEAMSLDVPIQMTDLVENSRSRILSQNLKNQALKIVASVSHHNGFEAYRRLCRHYQPTNKARSRGLLTLILQQNWSCKSVNDFVDRLIDWENLVSQYEVAGRSDRTISDHIKQSIVTSNCPAELRLHLQLNSERVKSYQDLKRMIMDYHSATSTWIP